MMCYLFCQLCSCQPYIPLFPIFYLLLSSLFYRNFSIAAAVRIVREAKLIWMTADRTEAVRYVSKISLPNLFVYTFPSLLPLYSLIHSVADDGTSIATELVNTISLMLCLLC